MFDKTFNIEILGSSFSFTVVNAKNFYIDWGDGNTEFYTGSNPEHTYSKSGKYVIKMSGYCTELSFYNNSNLVSVITPIESVMAKHIVSFNQCFSRCSNLVFIPVGLFDNCINATNFYECFAYCVSLRGIPSGLFDKCPPNSDLSYCFFDGISWIEFPYSPGRWYFNTNSNSFTYQAATEQIDIM